MTKQDCIDRAIACYRAGTSHPNAHHSVTLMELARAFTALSRSAARRAKHAAFAQVWYDFLFSGSPLPEGAMAFLMADGLF